MPLASTSPRDVPHRAAPRRAAPPPHRTAPRRTAASLPRNAQTPPNPTQTFAQTLAHAPTQASAPKLTISDVVPEPPSPPARGSAKKKLSKSASAGAGGSAEGPASPFKPGSTLRSLESFGTRNDV